MARLISRSAFRQLCRDPSLTHPPAVRLTLPSTRIPIGLTPNTISRYVQVNLAPKRESFHLRPPRRRIFCVKPWPKPPRPKRHRPPQARADVRPRVGGVDV